MPTRHLWTMVLWSTFALGVFSAHCSGQPSSVGQLQERIYAAVQAASPAVVEIHRPGSAFSGVIVSPQGHVFTAGHTIQPGLTYTISLPDGRRFRGQALGKCEQMRGERIDCGLIKIEYPDSLPYLPLGSTAGLRSDQPCLSLSYPGGQRADRQPVVRLGFVQRSLRPGRLLQSSALMEPGDSGGALVDLNGQLIAIHSRIGARMDQNFDVPVEVFRQYWDQLNIPETFSSLHGRAVPKLGFVGEDTPDRSGITIVQVFDGSLAQQIGLQAADVLTRVHDANLTCLDDLRPQLEKAIDSQAEQFNVAVLRGMDQVEYWVPRERLSTPKAERFAGLDSPPAVITDLPESLKRLEAFPQQFAALEDRLDDVCRIVESQRASTVTTESEQRHDRLLRCPVIAIAQSRWLVGKSSLVEQLPILLDGRQRIELEVVARDAQWDLVLLRSPQPNADGVHLVKSASQPRPGQLLVSADPEGPGYVSIVGSSIFQSQREASKGYLGVVLRDHPQGGAVLIQVDDGAAQRAGLVVGDVIVKLDGRAIRQRGDVLHQLGNSDPHAKLQATVLRNSQQFEVEIVLGTVPSSANHAADLVAKSLRRDGFPEVFCHDATLGVHECGGPVFDLQGNWVGLNTARYSRVRSFAVPQSAVVDFVRQNGG
ncbi:MAG: trypsin-like peptidase domain-containing protein [Pirellulaceae bacterium]|nr:trypsin-like peptidase domain-containing protein [Pirellulaceae bacterium]